MKNFQITGRTGNTPELNQKGETTFTKLHVAVRTRNNGTNWFYIAVFGKLAEIVAEYVTKGMVVAVSGDLRAAEYEGKYRIELVADKVDFFGAGGHGKPKESADDAKI